MVSVKLDKIVKDPEAGSGISLDSSIQIIDESLESPGEQEESPSPQPPSPSPPPPATPPPLPPRSANSSNSHTTQNKMEFSFGAKPPKEMNFNQPNLSAAWKFWIQKLEIFLDLVGIKEDARKVTAILSYIGDDGLRIYNTFPKSITFDEVVKKFGSHCDPRTNIVFERYKFLSARQKTAETIDQFLTHLKELVLACEYDTLQDSMVRDVFIIGLTDDKLRRLLLDIDDLTLEKTEKRAKSYILSQSQSQEMSTVTVHSESNINYVQKHSSSSPRPQISKGNNKQQQSKQGNSGKSNSYHSNKTKSNVKENESSGKRCERCGNWYHRTKCPALGQRCHICKGLNHFAKYCKSNKVQSLNIDNKSESSVDVNEDIDFFIGTLNLQESFKSNVDNSKTNTNFTEFIQINEKQIKVELDTGAEANVMSLCTFSSINYNKQIILNKCFGNLRAFGGSTVNVLGQCSVNAILSEMEEKSTYIDFLIVKENVATVLGKFDCVRLGLVHRNVGTVNQIQDESDHIIKSIPKEFNKLFKGLGCLEGEFNLKIDTEVMPVIDAPRKIPFQLHDKLKTELDRMEQNEVIARVNCPTSWVSSIVLVEKADGSLRLCLDPRNLNKALQREHYPIPSIEYIKSKLSGSKYYSTLDASKAYWMLKLNNKSSELCTFNTPFGRYRFLRMPYGVKVAQEIFHRVMTEMFIGMDVIVYVDDILVYGNSIQEHNEKLMRVLERMDKAGLKLNQDKCRFGLTEVKYFGHVFNELGIHADPQKVEAILNMPSPTCVKDVHRFLGMITYFGSFIQNLSNETEPLRQLLKKNIVFQWNESLEKVFSKLKSLVTEPPVLAYYDTSKPIVISADASQFAVGGCILQDNRPLAFASKTLTECQRNYAQIEKELYAILFSCEKYHQFIYGQTTLVETDHKPLIPLFKKALAHVPARLQRMMLRLQFYDLEVVYKPGRKLLVADMLSRAPLCHKEESQMDREIKIHVGLIKSSLAISQPMLKQIVNETARDKTMQQVRILIQSQWPENRKKLSPEIQALWGYRYELSVIDEMIFKGQALMIPSALIDVILKYIHDGHPGIEKSKRRARGLVFWPGMNADIQKSVENCKTCTKYLNNNRKESLIPHELPDLPFQKVGLDLFEWKKELYFLLVDYYSKYIEIAKLKSYKASEIIVNLKSIFARHGIPSQVISDNGPPFNSAEFKDFADDWKFDHTTSSPYYPKSNGLVERSIQTVKKLLTKCRETNTDPYLGLLNLRTTQHLMYSPSQLLMARKLRTRIPLNKSELKQSLTDDILYRQQTQQYQQKMKLAYDRHAKERPEIMEKVPVYFKKMPNEPWKKGKVVEIMDMPRSVIVKDADGKKYRRNKRDIIIDKTDDVSNSKSQTAIESEQPKDTLTLRSGKRVVKN
ncbi:uncharacterized protein K02A2.6-like [Episyrphus balteatus]|uniref:uncharacterized protein K02A2.6-like n=1 Tax=Episyrphus balteatus TaxID=286459 RepID=UPI002485ED72|nr:uncharacterized protein K02A2.6-like [Episyrphus balteatus]